MCQALKAQECLMSVEPKCQSVPRDPGTEWGGLGRGCGLTEAVHGSFLELW